MQKPKVVVVEDDEMNMRLFREVLRLNGYEAICLPSGDGLESLVQRAAPVAVLMDIQLPGASGIDLMRRLRARPETAGLPIHAVTAYAERLAETGDDRAGFDSVLPKPVDVPRLLSLVGGGGAAPAPAE